MIAFQCPKCQATFKAPEDKIGVQVKCPKCSRLINVPDPDSNAPVEGVVSVSPVDAEATEENIKAFAGKKIAAGLCGILLGQFGVHKFILGLAMPGVIMLVVSLIGLFGCGLGFFCFFPWFLTFGNLVMGIIGLIEGIMYLTKNDEEFYRLYAVEKRSWF